MLFTEYISINIKHVFIGVYNTQSHPSKSRGPHNSGAGGVGPAHLHGGDTRKRRQKGLRRGAPWTIKAFQGEKKGTGGGAQYKAPPTWPFPIWDWKTIRFG